MDILLVWHYDVIEVDVIIQTFDDKKIVEGYEDPYLYLPKAQDVHVSSK